jgi:hypothetical protein
MYLLLKEPLQMAFFDQFFDESLEFETPYSVVPSTYVVRTPPIGVGPNLSS